MGLFRTFRDTKKAYKAYLALPLEKRQLVFYAENSSAWPHLGPIVEELSRRGQALVYLTSAPDDVVFSKDLPGINPFCIGDGLVRVKAFMNLQCGEMVMTMPDLESLQIKRSRVCKDVHYTYIFHSLVSTHMIYRGDAFDHFDSILCSGPHHVAEIRKREASAELAPKELVHHGYGCLDSILAHLGAALEEEGSVLVAPSWGPYGLLEARGEDVIQSLRNQGLKVMVRPHPVTRERAPECIPALKKCFAEDDQVEWDEASASKASLYRSQCMVTDWSGVAFEYALGLEKPVLFIDQPRKVNHPDYEQLGIEPVEVCLRERMGRILSMDEVPDSGATIQSFLADRVGWKTRLVELRNEVVYNPGNSAAVAADFLRQRMEEGA